ncbi:hypothetical protein BHM03_00039941 [Ensete ventricosum]|nr:hypothetical protein BHM03_00039941 [Ensete ventricosum]
MLSCWDGLTLSLRWDRAQVVGWPPIRSYRKNTMAMNPPKYKEDVDGKLGLGCLYVKVSMEGAPYLRKVDLKTYKDYKELSSALEKMFSCFTIDSCKRLRIMKGSDAIGLVCCFLSWELLVKLGSGSHVKRGSSAQARSAGPTSQVFARDKGFVRWGLEHRPPVTHPIRREMKLKQLESLLGTLQQFSHPKAENTFGDINGKVVADFGCGCGTLGLASALLGAE